MSNYFLSKVGGAEKHLGVTGLNGVDTPVNHSRRARLHAVDAVVDNDESIAAPRPPHST